MSNCVDCGIGMGIGRVSRCMSCSERFLRRRVAELEAENGRQRAEFEHVRVMLTSAPDYAIQDDTLRRCVVAAIDVALATDTDTEGGR